MTAETNLTLHYVDQHTYGLFKRFLDGDKSGLSELDKTTQGISFTSIDMGEGNHCEVDGHRLIGPNFLVQEVREKTAVDRYFDEQMRDPEFAAGYHFERMNIARAKSLEGADTLPTNGAATIDVLVIPPRQARDDYETHQRQFNEQLERMADSLGITTQEAYERVLARGVGEQGA